MRYVQNKRMAIINCGAPACGMNAAMRAFVRMIVTHKFKAIAVNQGFQGLLHDEVGRLSSFLSFKLIYFVDMCRPMKMYNNCSMIYKIKLCPMSNFCCLFNCV